jgi:O-antigen ligase
MAITLCIIVVLKTGLLITGTLPMRTGLAAETMTATLFCSLFATRYMFGEKRALAWWSALAAIPVIALTRTGIVATGMSLALTFAPMKIFKRIILIILLCVIGYNIFYTERMQQKMFYSGRGTFGDIQRDNPNFATTGRFHLWEMMKYQIEKKPWFGHGANASETFVRAVTGGLTHPHNDWLRLRYDYGYIGTIIFAFCLLFQLLNALKRGRMFTEEIRILFYTGATSIFVFVLFMFTDNIILYAAFFGNLQFTILGLAYAARATLSDEKVKGRYISGE